MTDKELVESLKELGVPLKEEQVRKLEYLYQYMIEKNKNINLTRITEKSDVNLKHFYDSLTLYKGIDLNQVKTLCDIGTGAGFPGVVLKIVFPNLEVTLVDSLQKRVNYLNNLIKELDLTGIKAVHERGEDFAKSHREEFDVVTSRAVASLRIISEICIPLVKVDGYFIAMKGNVEEELNDAKSTVQALNAEIKEVIEFYLPKEESKRTLIKIRKINKTNPKYPRTIDKIKKIAL